MLDLDEIENDNENEQPKDFDDEQIEDPIEQNFEILEENPDENVKKIIFKGYEIYQNDNNLVKTILEVYSRFDLDNDDKGIDTLRLIISKANEFSNFNLSSRLIYFFEYILVIQDLEFEIIYKAVNKNYQKIENNTKDIIFFWKKNIAEEYLKEKNIFIDSEYVENCLNLLLEHNFNLNEINFIFNLFRNILISKNSTQFEIINSLISILILYPNCLNSNKKEIDKGEDKIEDEMKTFFNNYIKKVDVNMEKGEKKSEFIFDKDKNVALDFYLKVSSDKEYSNSSELTVPEIFQILKINNHDISEEKISKINDQLNIIQNIIENKRFQNYDKNDFQNWTKNDLPNLQFDENNADRSIAFILGMISLALKKNKGYFLRNTQLIAILLFISKEKKQGLIEEVSTGEGKSCIIASLCIYFALRKHKVDVISSSYTLAQRDSDEFQYLYNFFNLKTSYPFNSNSEPYTVDILYGTFLEFEGDCLRDMAYNRNIRNKRPFDVIIIDEVDNLFIDNILGSTRLTNSSLGFKFLIPIYLLLYLMFELIEYVFLLMFKINLDNLEGQEKTKKKFENLIKNPQKRKEELVKFFEKDIDSAFNLGIINPKKDDVKYKKEFNKEEFKDRFNEAGLSMGEYLGNLDKFVEHQNFWKILKEQKEFIGSIVHMMQKI